MGQTQILNNVLRIKMSISLYGITINNNIHFIFDGEEANEYYFIYWFI